MRFVVFLPAVLAALTDLLVAFIVRANQPNYPGRVIILQAVMLSAALLVTLPHRWVLIAGFVLLLAGVFTSLASVGMFYVPTVIAAAWIASRRSAATS